MEKSRSGIKIEDAVKVLTYGIGLVGFLSVVRFTGFFYSLAFGFFYLLSLRSERRKRYPAPRWALNTTALVLIILTFLGMNSRDIVTPALNSLLLLLAIKFLEEKRFRDYMQIYVISVFLLTGSSLLSLDIVFLVYFLSLIFLLTLTTVLLAYYSQDPLLEITTSTVFKVASTAFLISFLSLPATLFLFLLLPRTSFPLFTFLNRQGTALSGFSDSVMLGGISRIQENNEVVFRAHMERVDEGSLYWRGLLLDHFDGVSWRISPGRKRGGDSLTVRGKRVEQTIYLEPTDNKYLFALDKPLSLSLKQARMDSTLIPSLPENVTHRIKYQALSILSPVLQVRETNRDAYLQLPEADTAEIRRVVAPLAAGKDTAGTVNVLLAFLGGGGYKYSLEGLPLSAHPLHDFLFVTKRGNCEYFASALAVMLRVAGIPSRIVGGYRGGLYNEMGGYYLVPQGSAHVWVEFYQESVGWIRVDPTPAGGESHFHRRKGMLLRMQLLLDTLNYYWNASVLNYDLGRQMSLLSKVRLGFGRPSLSLSLDREKLTSYTLLLLIVASGGFAVYFFFFQRKTPEEILLGDFLAKMKKKGYTKAKEEGLEEFLERIGDITYRERAMVFVREFEEYFYRDRSLGKGEIRNLRRMLREL